VIEASDDGPGQPTATGTLTDTDVDNTPNTFTAVISPTASAGGYGTFTMTAAGVWSYALDSANHAVQALDADDTLTDSFRVTTVDGTGQVVTITIHGSNDADRDDFDFDAHDFLPSSTAQVVFGSAATLGLRDSFHFKDETSGVAGSNTTNPADGGHTLAPINETAAGSQGPPAISVGAQTIELSLPGQHAADHSGIVPDHAGGAVVTLVPHDLMV
jgi:VCBS repeat-containing protein